MLAADPPRIAAATADLSPDQRAGLLRTLESQPPEAWARSAIVSVAGKPYERTVLFYARWLAEHERPHLKQIERFAYTPHA